MTSPPNIILFTGEGTPTFQEWTMKLKVIGKKEGWSDIMGSNKNVQALRGQTTISPDEQKTIESNDSLADYIILLVSGKALDVCEEASRNHDAFELLEALKKSFHKETPKAKLQEMRELRLDNMELRIYFEKLECLNEKLGKLKTVYKYTDEMLGLQVMANLPSTYHDWKKIVKIAANRTLDWAAINLSCRLIEKKTSRLPK